MLLNKLHKISAIIILIYLLMFTPIMILSVSMQLDNDITTEVNTIEKNETANNIMNDTFFISPLHSRIINEYMEIDGSVSNNQPVAISPIIIGISTSPKQEDHNIKLDEDTNNNEIEQLDSDCEVVEEIVVEEEIPKNSDLYSETDIYELAKIIMCEAEGESQKCKEYVGQVVLNRLKSGKYGNTMHSVIFANNGKTYQFSPVKPGGRWWRVEPNQDCYDAAYSVLNASEPFTNAMYFEDCKGDSWHSRNLTKVATVDGMRFYVE